MRNLLIAFLLLTLTGCSLFGKQTNITSSPVDKPQLILPEVDKLNLRKIKWTIITKENFSSKISALEGQGSPIAIFGLTGDGYTNLSINMAQLRQLIQQQQSIINAYEEYYIATESSKTSVK